MPHTSSGREADILKTLFCVDTPSQLQLINNSSKIKYVKGLPSFAADNLLLKNTISYSFLYIFFPFLGSWIKLKISVLTKFFVSNKWYRYGAFHFFIYGATAMPSHQVVASSRGRKPQHQAGSSGAAVATVAGSSLEGTHQVMLKMESHSEMSEVSRLTVCIWLSVLWLDNHLSYMN
jgi:hypothetical protein